METAEQYAFAWGWLTQNLATTAGTGRTLDPAAILAAIREAEQAAVADSKR